MSYAEFIRAGFFVFDQPGFWFNRNGLGGSVRLEGARFVAELVLRDALQAGAVRPCGVNAWQVTAPKSLPRCLRSVPLAA